jgi:hypothetical protein
MFTERRRLVRRTDTVTREREKADLVLAHSRRLIAEIDVLLKHSRELTRTPPTCH